MGGVDIADQLRAGFSTQQQGLKPWRLLFYWLLDSTIINTFCLSDVWDAIGRSEAGAKPKDVSIVPPPQTSERDSS